MELASERRPFGQSSYTKYNIVPVTEWEWTWRGCDDDKKIPAKDAGVGLLLKEPVIYSRHYGATEFPCAVTWTFMTKAG